MNSANGSSNATANNRDENRMQPSSIFANTESGNKFTFSDLKIMQNSQVNTNNATSAEASIAFNIRNTHKVKDEEEEFTSAEGHVDEPQNALDRKLLTKEAMDKASADTRGVVPVKFSQLAEIEAKVRVELADGESKYLGDCGWEDLNLSAELLRGIYQKGFHKPSKIQAAALPLIINESANLVAQAKNGSGKTATFVLCMISKISLETKQPQALCLCPTRELARQILDVVLELGKYTKITSYLAVPQQNHYNPSEGAQIVVGTPGKVIDLLKRKTLPSMETKLLVLDEADEMIDHRNNMAPQVQQVRHFLPQHIQILLFSATFSDIVREFAHKMVPRANKITVEKTKLSLESVSQFYMVCSDDHHKFQILSDLYGCMTIGQSVIFAKSRKSAFDLAHRMKKAGHAISLICGTQSQGPERMDHEMRDKIMAEFRNGETRVLICTDVLSRGIDVPQVTLVINYDLPMDYQGRVGGATSAVSMETYIHRIGRTGRFGLKGIAISLIERYELNLINAISEFYNFPIKELSNDPEEIEKMVTELRL